MRSINWIFFSSKFVSVAGICCKKANRINFAFIFLNHFLDLVDAIQEQDANLVDYNDLEQTDIPMKVPLPSKVFLFQGEHHSNAEKQIEHVKSWILEKSMDSGDYSLFSNDLDTKSNDDNLFNENNLVNISKRSIYEANLIRNDGTQSMVCLVTAYPVLDNDQFDLKPGKYAANRSDWNRLIMIIKVRIFFFFDLFCA